MLLPIRPVAPDTWSALVDDPSTGAMTELPDLVVPGDTLLLFAGGRDLPGSELGRGGFGAFTASGTPEWLDLVASRGQVGALAPIKTDFGPFGGSITFDTKTNWYFGRDDAGQASGQDDFLSVATHELEHLLGFGTAPSWFAQAIGGRFGGAASIAYYDVPGTTVPLSPDGGHWANGTLDGGVETLMDPSLLTGTRKLPTRLDFAGLQDVGWTLSGDLDGTTAGAIDAGLAGAGTVVLDGMQIGPDPTDVDLYQFSAAAGSVLTASTTPVVGGRSIDTAVRLFDGFGRAIASADRFTYDTLSVTLPASGTYYLGVSGSGNVAYSVREDLFGRIAGPTGDYGLSLRLDPAAGGTVADLATLVVAPTSVNRGEAFTYTVTVANNGPDAAGAVRLAVPIPAATTFLGVIPSQGTAGIGGGVLSLSFGAIAPGGTATALVTVRADSAGDRVFAASATATQIDPDSSNDAASATTAVVAPPPPVDSVPPIVLQVRRLTFGQGRKRITLLLVDFSEPVDPTTAASVGAYNLTKNGRARRNRPIPRVPVGLVAANYAVSTIVLVPAFRGNPPRGLRLAVLSNPFSGVRDLAGNPLDGNRDGIGGDGAEFPIV